MGYQARGLLWSEAIRKVLGPIAVIIGCAFLRVAGAEGIAPERAQTLLDQGKTQEAKALLAEALDEPDQHFAAYGQLVGLAIAAKDERELERLFKAHRAYPYVEPGKFQQRVQDYELLPLRRAYNEAVQAALARQWRPAQEGFHRLLGDAAFHRQAVVWLFRIAMQQHAAEQAQFIAGLADKAADDPASSRNVLEACAAQRRGERKAALQRLHEELQQRGAFGRQREARLDAQGAVYLAMIRLHIELDQCFLGAMTTVAEAKPIFPDLEDEVLGYLARR